MYYTPKLHPLENVLHVLWDKEENVLTIEDDHHNNYRVIVKEELNSYTWNPAPTLPVGSMMGIATARPERK